MSCAPLLYHCELSCRGKQIHGLVMKTHVRGEGQRRAHPSYLDNGSTGERWLLLRRRKPQGSPFSRWGCVSGAEAIRPVIILHLLYSIVVPQLETRLPPNPEDRAPTVARKSLTEHDEAT